MRGRGETLAAIAELAGVKVGDVRAILSAASAPATALPRALGAEARRRTRPVTPRTVRRRMHQLSRRGDFREIGGQRLGGARRLGFTMSPPSESRDLVRPISDVSHATDPRSGP
jgi:hypothetical protein